MLQERAKIYPSRIGRGVIIPVYLIVFSVGAILIYDSFWGGLAFTLLIAVFVGHMLCTTNYTIQQDLLVVKSGFFFRKEIRIGTIVKLEDTTSILSSPAASITGRIEIRYNKQEIIIVSPKDKDGFIRHLIEINPDIQLKLRTKMQKQ